MNTTKFTYDPNGNPLTTLHDDQFAEYAYDVRDLVEQVTNGDSASDPDPKLTGYTYTARGQTATEDTADTGKESWDRAPIRWSENWAVAAGGSSASGA